MKTPGLHLRFPRFISLTGNGILTNGRALGQADSSGTIAEMLGGSSEDALSWLRGISIDRKNGDIHEARIWAAGCAYLAFRKHGLSAQAEIIANMLVKVGYLVEDTPHGSIFLNYVK